MFWGGGLVHDCGWGLDAADHVQLDWECVAAEQKRADLADHAVLRGSAVVFEETELAEVRLDGSHLLRCVPVCFGAGALCGSLRRDLAVERPGLVPFPPAIARLELPEHSSDIRIRLYMPSQHVLDNQRAEVSPVRACDEDSADFYLFGARLVYRHRLRWLSNVWRQHHRKHHYALPTDCLKYRWQNSDRTTGDAGLPTSVPSGEGLHPPDFTIFY